MKKIAFLIFCSVVFALSANASYGCKTVMSSFKTADLNSPTGWGSGDELDAAIFYQYFRTQIETLETTQGNLQSIPINVGTQAGTSSLNMSWSALIISLAKKLAASPSGDQDIRWLLSSLEPKVANIVATQASLCSWNGSEKDGAENVVLMIKWSAEYGHLADFLSKSSIYLKNGNPKIPKKMTDEELRKLPFSKMPPI